MLNNLDNKKCRKEDISFKSDGRYKTLFEQVNAAVFLSTLNGEILEANMRSCELLGYSWDELDSMKINNLFPETCDWPTMMDEISSKGGLNFESENQKKDGTIFPVSVSTSLFTIKGKPVMLTLIQDITERKKAEAKLKASEEKYRKIFENSAVAIMLTDKDENIISWNSYTEKLLGKGKKELQKKPVKSLYPEDEWLKIRKENIREKGMQHHLESKMIRKDGELIDVDLSVSVLRDVNGEISGSIGVVRDVSERKKAERKLLENEQKYRGLFESTTDGMIILDARGEIQDANSCALKIFGLKKEDIVGKNFLSMDVLTPNSLPIVVKQFGDLLSGNKATTHETEIKDKDNNILNVEISSFFLVRKENEVDNFVVIVRNISDRKQTEIKLAKEHGLLQTLMDNIPDSIYFKDDKHRFVLVNKAKASHSNVKPEEMAGKTDFDFLPEEQAKSAFEDDERVLKKGEYIINKIEKLENLNGETRWVSVTKVPRFDPEGNIIGTAGITRDLTEMKKISDKIKLFEVCR